MRPAYKHLFLLVSFVTLCACGPDASNPGNFSQALGADGTPEAVGLLRFVNDESTTFEILDNDVPLDRRAAQNLVPVAVVCQLQPTIIGSACGVLVADQWIFPV